MLQKWKGVAREMENTIEEREELKKKELKGKKNPYRSWGVEILKGV